MRWKERGRVREKAWITAAWTVPVLAACNSILGIESDYHLASGGMSAGGSAGSGASAGKNVSAGKGGTSASGGSSEGGSSGHATGGTAARGGSSSGGTGQGGDTGGSGDTSGTAGGSGAGDAGDGSGGTGGSQGGSAQGGGGAAGMGTGGAATAGTGTAGTGTAGTGMAGTSSAGTSSIAFYDHFTGDTIGEVPAGWETFVDNQIDSSTQTAVLVDDTHHHYAAPGVHINATDPDSNIAQLIRPLPRGLPTIYVAFWMYATRRIGGQTSGYADAGLVTLRTNSGQTSKEIRFGEMNGTLGVHVVPRNDIDVPGGSSSYFKGGQPYYAPNTWQCVQVAFVAGTGSDDPDKIIFANGGTPYTLSTTDVAAPWDSWVSAIVGGPGPELAIGWESSNLGAAAMEFWIDDVVIGDQWASDCPGSTP
jgi:hypothetical protein